MVYVDELRPTHPRPGWRYRSSCHMTADTLAQLDVMAHKLGLKPSWFQDGKYPHYDLTASKRVAALGLGVQEITAREWIKRQRVRA